MARALAIDFGFKRTGISVTDPEKRIATPLEVIQTPQLWQFLEKYMQMENVDVIVIGEPKKLDGSDTHTSEKVRQLVRKMKETYKDKKVELIDERFTSRMALDSMIQGGMKKKDRQKKGNVDKISATIILQSWLDSRREPF